MRPSWGETWAAIASVMAARSNCTRRKVGAVLVKGNRLLSSGYNGPPPKAAHCDTGGCPRGRLLGPLPEDYTAFPCTAVHAEANALLRAGSVASGATLYCTHRPCPQCQNLIMGAGVERVMWPAEYATSMNVWIPAKGFLP